MEDFVRRWNMDGYDREWTPISSMSVPDRRGLVNEAGFVLFSKIIALPRAEVGPAIASGMDGAFREAASYIYGSDAESHWNYDNVEKREAGVIAARLFIYFRTGPSNGSVTVSPKFHGSGMISSCVGDVMSSDGDLFEIKSGDRKFRSLDYRQLAVYGALHFAKTKEIVKSINVVNPRTGLIVTVESNRFAQEVSGQSAASFFQTLISSFSENLVSL